MFLFISSVPSEQREGGRGGCQTSRFCSLFSVQQTTSGIGHYYCAKKVGYVGLATNTLNLRNNNIERYSIQKRRPSATYILYYTGKLVIADGSVEFCETTA